MKPPFRSKQEVIINAPLETVWAFSMDITRIPTFHLRVVKVELLSGKALREPGVSYQCHLSGGKHTCVEKDIEVVPMERGSLRSCRRTPSESARFSQTMLWKLGSIEPELCDKGGNQPFLLDQTLKAKLLNLIAKRRIARETQDTLKAAKAAIETTHAAQH